MCQVSLLVADCSTPFTYLPSCFAFSALTLLVGRQEGHPACKKTEWWGAGVVICLELDADLHMAQLMPLPLTVSCFSKIQIGFTFLVPAHPGSPGHRAVKRVCACVRCRRWIRAMLCMSRRSCCTERWTAVERRASRVVSTWSNVDLVRLMMVACLQHIASTFQNTRCVSTSAAQQRAAYV